MDARSNTIASALSQLVAEGAGADRIAAVVAEKMHAIHSALAPIIGDQGVSALYRRCLFLVVQDATRAAPFYSSAGGSDDYAALQSALTHQQPAEALKIAEALFANLYRILVSLIGVALTERLLYPMFDTSPNGNAVQENPHE